VTNSGHAAPPTEEQQTVGFALSDEPLVWASDPVAHRPSSDEEGVPDEEPPDGGFEARLADDVNVFASPPGLAKRRADSSRTGVGPRLHGIVASASDAVLSQADSLTGRLRRPPGQRHTPAGSSAALRRARRRRVLLGAPIALSIVIGLLVALSSGGHRPAQARAHAASTHRAPASVSASASARPQSAAPVAIPSLASLAQPPAARHTTAKASQPRGKPAAAHRVRRPQRHRRRPTVSVQMPAASTTPAPVTTSPTNVAPAREPSPAPRVSDRRAPPAPAPPPPGSEFGFEQ
jgi:hypothetical protein